MFFKYLLIFIIALMFSKPFANGQTAYNNYLNTEVNLLEGIRDSEVLANGDWVSTYSKYFDSIGIAYFDKYGHLVWKTNVATATSENSSHYSNSITIINDSIFAMVEIVYNPEVAFPEIEGWTHISYIHIFNNKGELLNTFSPISSLPAYRYEYIEVDSNGNLLLLGYGGNTDVSYKFDITLLKTDLEGNTLNEYIVSDTIYRNHGMTLDYINGDIVFGKLDYHSGILQQSTIFSLNNDFELNWNTTFEKQIWHFNVSQALDGNLLFAANTNEIVCTGGGDSVITLIKLDSETGEVLVEETYIDDDMCDGYHYGIVQQPDSSYLSGGYFWRGKPWENNDTLSAYVMKLDTNFSLVWKKHYNCVGNQWEEYIRSVEPTPDGGLLLTGWTRGIPPENDEAIWALKVDSLGNEWLPLNAFFEQDTIYMGLGESITLNPIPYGGTNSYSHNWLGDTNYLNEVNVWYPVFSPSEAGVYDLQYEVTDNNGDTATAIQYVNVEDITSSNNLFTKAIKVYPNPVSETLHIQNAESWTSELTISSITGKVLITVPIKNGINEVDVSSLLGNRIYIYTINSNTTQNHKGKFLKLNRL